jgi:hypothetical protein
MACDRLYRIADHRKCSNAHHVITRSSVTLPQDWRFADDHRALDEAGAIATGERTLLDFAATVALTDPGECPEDTSFGAGLGTAFEAPIDDPRALGEQLRGYLLEDARVEEVATDATSEAGQIQLPVSITPADGPFQLTGLLTTALIEEMIIDMAQADEDENNG